MRIEGACHCGNVRLSLDWPGEPAQIPVRECGCSFCRKHGAAWTSHPDASLRLDVEDDSLLSRYRFGTATADFQVCARCGAVPAVLSEIEGRTFAVVNVNCFVGVDAATLSRAPADFDGEGTGERLARRARNWIGDVRS